MGGGMGMMDDEDEVESVDEDELGRYMKLLFGHNFASIVPNLPPS